MFGLSDVGLFDECHQFGSLVEETDLSRVVFRGQGPEFAEEFALVHFLSDPMESAMRVRSAVSYSPRRR